MVHYRMLKTEAIKLFEGSIAQLSEEVGVSYRAVHKWPDVLPDRISDRVQAALWRREHGMKRPAPIRRTKPPAMRAANART